MLTLKGLTILLPFSLQGWSSKLLHLYPMVPPNVWLVMDKANDSSPLTKNFRLCRNAFASEKIQKFKNTTLPTRQGLDTLQCSGSAQFSLNSFLYIMQQVKTPLMVVDLRHEPHFFNDGHAISFFMQGSNNFYNSTYDDRWFEVEQGLLSLLQKEVTLSVNLILEKENKVIQQASIRELTRNNLLTEEDLVKQYNVGYIRLPVLDSHLPDDVVIDKFIDMVQTLPQDMWLHFHCRGGKGRTSLFMTFYDIYRNAHKVSLKDIIDRQSLLNPSNFHEYPDIRRKKTLTLLENFYNYIKDEKGLGYEPWSAWRKKRQLKT